MSETTITFRVFRYRPADGPGRFEQSRVPVGETTTVLDVLEMLHRKDPALMHRHSCHHGSCGTCACRVNGRERLACTTRVLELGSEVVSLEPLAGFRKAGDLVIEMADFFLDFGVDWQTKRASEANPTSTPPGELAGFTRLENCIECGACVSACPVDDFLGPAVLAGLNRERINRPEKEQHLLEPAAGPQGVWKCARALECSRVCPTAVYPARHIQELRKMLKDPKQG
jgi:succinate dehydrogenase / fumarate reductase iron-sulfur subunit